MATTSARQRRREERNLSNPVQLWTRVTEEEAEILENNALANGRSMSAEVRYALKLYLASLGS